MQACDHVWRDAVLKHAVHHILKPCLQSVYDCVRVHTGAVSAGHVPRVCWAKPLLCHVWPGNLPGWGAKKVVIYILWHCFRYLYISIYLNSYDNIKIYLNKKIDNLKKSDTHIKAGMTSCQPWTVCVAGVQYETLALTPTSDRNCSNCTLASTCKPGQMLKMSCSGNASPGVDSKCIACANNTYQNEVISLVIWRESKFMWSYHYAIVLLIVSSKKFCFH